MNDRTEGETRSETLIRTRLGEIGFELGQLRSALERCPTNERPALLDRIRDRNEEQARGKRLLEAGTPEGVPCRSCAATGYTPTADMRLETCDDCGGVGVVPKT